jgi:DNA topoisomerase-2
MIRGEFVEPVWNPWWRNFQGSVTMSEPDKYTVTGCYERVDDRTLQITELPVGTWTTPYKTFLDELVKEGKIRDYTCMIDDTNVDIRVDLNDRPSDSPAPVENIFEAEIQRKRTADAAASGGGASNSKKVRVNNINVVNDVSLLKLTTKVSTSNVHLFSSPFESKSSIRRYTIRDIYNEFYAVRMRAYTLRKEYQVNKLEDTLSVVRARIDFIRAKVDGRLVIENRDIDEVCVEMEQMGLPRRNGEYDYLLDMKLSSLTRQRILKLEEEFDSLTAELRELKNTSESTMWLRELDELERNFDRN